MNSQPESYPFIDEPRPAPNPQFEFRDPQSGLPNPQSEIPNPQSTALNPEPQTLNPPPEPRTLNPPAPPRRRRGRPRRLDDAKRREVCALISAGTGIAAAARYVGCAASTIQRESMRNDDFREQLRRAGLAAQLSPLNAMRRAADTHWRAAAWLLERVDPDRFAKQNVKVLKREHIAGIVTYLIEVLSSEIHDAETRHRIIRRFEQVIENCDRELDARNESFLDPPRSGRRSGFSAPHGPSANHHAVPHCAKNER